MTMRFARLAALAVLALAPQAMAQTAPQPVQVAFTDSTIAGLAPTKRVAITSVIVSFQASVGTKKEGGGGMFADKSSTKSMMAMPDMDEGLQDVIVADAYRHLKADLIAAGYEIVPEADVAADPSYKEIISKVGFVNHSKALNALGDAVLVSPPSLTPYMPYTMEGSPFESGVTSYLGWPSGWGKSATPGGFNLMTAATFYKLPGLEVALAKSLNANVVKAFYVVNIGKTTAAHSRSIGAVSGDFGRTGIGSTYTGTASAFAQVGLMPDQTRIAFRSPTGNAKWQKVNLNKPGPAKDGDVVVHLAEPLLGGTDYFKISGDGGRERGKYILNVAEFEFTYFATLTDNGAYQRDVEAMIASATKSMVGLVAR